MYSFISQVIITLNNKKELQIIYKKYRFSSKFSLSKRIRQTKIREGLTNIREGLLLFNTKPICISGIKVSATQIQCFAKTLNSCKMY